MAWKKKLAHSFSNNSAKSTTAKTGKQKPYLSNQDHECQGQHQLKKKWIIFYLPISWYSKLFLFISCCQNYYKTDIWTEQQISKSWKLRKISWSSFTIHILQTIQNLVTLPCCFAENGTYMLLLCWFNVLFSDVSIAIAVMIFYESFTLNLTS